MSNAGNLLAREIKSLVDRSMDKKNGKKSHLTYSG